MYEDDLHVHQYLLSVFNFSSPAPPTRLLDLASLRFAPRHSADGDRVPERSSRARTRKNHITNGLIKELFKSRVEPVRKYAKNVGNCRIEYRSPKESLTMIHDRHTIAHMVGCCCYFAVSGGDRETSRRPTSTFCSRFEAFECTLTRKKRWWSPERRRNNVTLLARAFPVLLSVCGLREKRGVEVIALHTF